MTTAAHPGVRERQYRQFSKRIPKRTACPRDLRLSPRIHSWKFLLQAELCSSISPRSWRSLLPMRGAASETSFCSLKPAPPSHNASLVISYTSTSDQHSNRVCNMHAFRLMGQVLQKDLVSVTEEP